MDFIEAQLPSPAWAKQATEGILRSVVSACTECAPFMTTTSLDSRLRFDFRRLNLVVAHKNITALLTANRPLVARLSLAHGVYFTCMLATEALDSLKGNLSPERHAELVSQLRDLHRDAEVKFAAAYLHQDYADKMMGN